jgi:hypothetical protein
MANQSSAVWSHHAQVLAFDDSWKYSDVDLAAPSGWEAAAFNDSDTSFWKSGPGPFDGKRGATPCRTTSETSFQLPNVGTCIVITNLANAANTNNIPSYYFRTHFQYPYAVQGNAMLKLSGKFDDGAVVWLNGVELTRIGVNATNPLFHTNYNSARTVGGDNPDNEYTFPASALHSGDNVVAVYLAQVNATSSDITMGLKLTSSTIAPLAPAVTGPRLTISRSGSDLSVGWTPPGGKLVSGPNINGPWTTNASPSNPTIVTPSPAKQFYFISE